MNINSFSRINKHNYIRCISVVLNLFLTAFLFISCGNSEDGNVVKSYYDDGTLKSELRYKDGKLNGESVWYYSNGKPQMKINYTNDTLNGEAGQQADASYL